MKITIEHYNKKHTVEIFEDVDIWLLTQVFAGFALQLGYSESNVREAFQEIEL